MIEFTQLGTWSIFIPLHLLVLHRCQFLCFQGAPFLKLEDGLRGHFTPQVTPLFLSAAASLMVFLIQHYYQKQPERDCMHAQSHLTLCNPMDCGLPGLSVQGFSRQEYWSGLPFPFSGIFLIQGLNPHFPHCRQILYHMSHLKFQLHKIIKHFPPETLLDNPLLEA